ncbi:MAG: glycosyltransferase [Flavobacteriaceae bacterium]
MATIIKKRVLIITYYWPPSGGAGVQRWLKHAKYLPEFDWEPIIFTAADAHYPVLDESLQKDIAPNLTVLKGEIWEPYEWYKRAVGMKKGEKVQPGFIDEKKKPTFIEDLAIWIRGNFFIPDARKFWIKPSVKYLTTYIKENKIDLVVSTGPPHTTHIIARNVKRKINIKWIADFRDPWTKIDFYHHLKLSKWADRQHRAMEQSVLLEADDIVAAGWGYAKGLETLGAKKVKVITNGYDESDFQLEKVSLTKKFTLSHIGSLNKDRNPQQLWKALQELCQEYESFKQNLEIRLIGKTDIKALEDIEMAGLANNLNKIAYIPHQEVINHTSTSQVLLLIINRIPTASAMLPGKVFEYLAAQRPIISIGPSRGDAAKIIRNANAGVTIDFEDTTKMKSVILDYFQRYQNKKLDLKDSDIAAYSRRNLAQQMSNIFNNVIT